MLLDYDALKKWFEQEKRDFPWRKNPSPYAVWISEVMLQQTRASYVISYFTRWMKQFPTVASLAEAPLEKVIKLWEGLGYYQRARHLHLGAKKIVQEHKGEVPSTPEALKMIPGIGEYTRNAILAFAFSKKEIAIDANVKRVFSRLFSIEERLDTKKAKEKLFAIQKTIQKESFHSLAEPFIELGALICLKKPLCMQCPLKTNCQAFQQKEVEKYPVLPPKKEILLLKRAIFLLEYQGHILVQKVREEKLMKDLYQFFYEEYLLQSFTNWEKRIAETLSMTVSFERRFLPVKQSFTRYRALLYPFLFSVKKPVTPFGFEWIEKEELKKLPFCSGHRKILQQYLQIAR